MLPNLFSRGRGRKSAEARAASRRALPAVQALEDRCLFSASVDLNTVGLTPTVIKSTLPAAAISNQKVKGSVTVTLTNSGTVTDTGLDSIALYATADGVLVAGDAVVTSLTHRYSIKAGHSVNVGIPVKALALPAGTFTLIPEVINAANVTQSASAGPVIGVEAPYIALKAAVGGVRPATVKSNHVASFTITLTNTGNTNSTGPVAISVGLSTDGVNLFRTVETIGRKATVKANGKAANIGVAFKVPTDLAAGVYYPYLVVTQGTTTLDVIGTSPFTVTD